MDDPNTITPANPEPVVKNEELWPSQLPQKAMEPLKQPCTVRTVATGDKVYLVYKDQRRWVTSPEALAALGYKLGDEETISYQRLQQYPEIEPVNLTAADLIRIELGNKDVNVVTEPEKPEETVFSKSEAEVAFEMEQKAEADKTPEPETINENFYYQTQGKRPEAIFIIPFIMPDYITRCLETLRKNTPIDLQVIVVDDSIEKNQYEKNKDKVELWINSYRNLGFAKGHNTGAVLAMRQEPKYIVFSNDDVEFINKNWWQGILDTFAQDKHIAGVNPDSPRVAMWGYGVNDGYLDIVDYKPEFSQEEYDFLLAGDFSKIKAEKKVFLPDGSQVPVPETFPARHTGVIDAVATWCTAFRTDMLKKIGLWDERFYPGSGEDYDMMARAYSTAWPERRDAYDEEQHFRVVGTTKSWVWHHWTKSKDYLNKHPELAQKLSGSRPNFSDAGGPWRDLNDGNFDVWGHYDKAGVKTPIKREKKIIVESL